MRPSQSSAWVTTGKCCLLSWKRWWEEKSGPELLGSGRREMDPCSPCSPSQPFPARLRLFSKWLKNVWLKRCLIIRLPGSPRPGLAVWLVPTPCSQPFSRPPFLHVEKVGLDHMRLSGSGLRGQPESVLWFTLKPRLSNRIWSSSCNFHDGSLGFVYPSQSPWFWPESESRPRCDDQSKWCKTIA